MDKDLTPLGELLESARAAVRPKLSQNAVAARAGTSPTTYRRVITGIARLGGRDVPFDGSADTIARIAMALGVTAEDLERAGRADAAGELRMLADDGSTGYEGEDAGGGDQFEEMDRTYHELKRDPEIGPVLDGLFASLRKRKSE